MNDATIELESALEDKLRAFLVRLLKLDEDQPLPADADLIQQIGLDSIEAFDAIATLHELLDAVIPENFNPKVVNSIRTLARYVLDAFGDEAVRRFVALDLETVTAFDAEEDL
ncbi:phosphopantetheine-binding protein [Chromobacterium phragmitis]|uniref:phosphopantetheine-binding protein n=1 Tax=Chromobacterium phragmitis TaxID=2202141 RepID=UPI00143D5336|nr:phosphopantetheine-binding protein [Chromobacterium phragmitis]